MQGSALQDKGPLRFFFICVFSGFSSIINYLEVKENCVPGYQLILQKLKSRIYDE
jgi:hypothetical protein